MDCPVCKKPFIVVERNSIELDYCLDCKGIWFDDGELQLLAKQLNLKFEISDMESAKKGLAIEKQYKCPRCGKPMEKFFMGDIILDRCADKHGLWFDSGELGKFFDLFATSKETSDKNVVHFLGEVFNQ
jgi:Zn-finger nucleic acid-binding protein